MSEQMVSATVCSGYRPLMVMGGSSSAERSSPATALCAWFRPEGVDVASYKPQNMSSNARVVAGGEIGSPSGYGRAEHEESFAMLADAVDAHLDTPCFERVS